MEVFSNQSTTLVFEQIDSFGPDENIVMNGLVDRIRDKYPEKEDPANWSKSISQRLARSVADPEDHRFPLEPAGYYPGTRKKILGRGNSVAYKLKN